MATLDVITNGDISFVNWLRFRYSDVVVTLVLAGETCVGPPFLNGTFQGSVESTLDMLVSLELVARLVARELVSRSLWNDQVLGGFGDDLHQAMVRSLEPACVVLDNIWKLKGPLGLVPSLTKMKIIALLREQPELELARLLSVHWINPIVVLDALILGFRNWVLCAPGAAI